MANDYYYIGSGQLYFGMEREYPKISVIILNWNHWAKTLGCIESVLVNTYAKFDCIIVDNGSSDESEEHIARWFEKKKNVVGRKGASLGKRNNGWKHLDIEASAIYDYHRSSKSQAPVRVYLLQSGSNLGYSGGNNIGIDRALEEGCEYALIMNNDATVRDDFIEKMVETALDSNASAIGALIKDTSGKKILFSGTRLLEASIGCLSQRHSKSEKWWETDGVQGCGMMLHRELLVRRHACLGYFLDPSLFLYCEEIELAFWCKREGFRSVIAGNAELFHELGTSLGGGGNPVPFYYLTRNRLNVAKRYLKGTRLVLYKMVFVPLRVIRAFSYLFLGKEEITHAIVRGLIDGLRNIRGPARHSL